MARQLVAALADHAEDIALAMGALFIAGGLGWKLGWWAALVAFGVLAVAYGVWITTGGPAWVSPAREE